MLQATEKLRALYRQPIRRYNDRDVWRKNYVSVVVHHGSAEDADVLLPYFLADPTVKYELIEPLMAHGNQETAKAIFDVCFSNGMLVEDMPPTVLQALGYLGFEDAEPVLWQHFLQDDHEIHSAAAMGLLNLPCHDLIGDIESAVRQCLGRGLFPEFAPALAYKTGNLELLHEIKHLGETTASSDCNGGIILGIALYGEAGENAFRGILWNEWWDASDSGTGSLKYLYCGLRSLGIRIIDLYHELRHRLADGLDNRVLKYHARCLVSLVSIHVEDAMPSNGWFPTSAALTLRSITDPGDNLAELHEVLFASPDPDYNDTLEEMLKSRFDDDIGAFDMEGLEERLELEAGRLLQMEVMLADQQPPSNE